MYIQPSEITGLLVALFLTPVMWAGVRYLGLAGKRFFVGAYSAMLVAFVASVVEQRPPFALFELCNGVEHLALAVAGVLFAVAAGQLARHRRGGEAR